MPIDFWLLEALTLDLLFLFGLLLAAAGEAFLALDKRRRYAGDVNTAALWVVLFPQTDV